MERASSLDLRGKPGTLAIAHVPGDRGYPLLGHTPQILSDLYGFTWRMYRAYGPVFRVRFLFRHFVWLLGPEVTQTVLMDRDRVFSSALGWDARLGRLFPGGLMLRDFDDHRYHRRLMQGAFTPAALEGYLPVIDAVVGAEVAALAARARILAYPEIKRISLRIALCVFLGDDVDEADRARLSEAFVALLGASVALIQRDVPGSTFAAGLRGRRVLVDFVTRLVARRRQAPGRDLLSQLCTAEDPSGSRYSADDVANHMIFLLMAAHDTTASALTTTLYCLARHPGWQHTVREECGAEWPGPSDTARLGSLLLTECAINEALRLYAPVGMFPRRTIAPVNVLGVDLPANTAINLSPGFNHYMEEYWTRPLEFDPDRFAAPRSEHRQHPFLWIPFGAGAHKCIGMHFAYLESKVFLRHLLRRLAISVADAYEARYRMAPVPRPIDGLPLMLTPRA